jgi:hypothetical protein
MDSICAQGNLKKKDFWKCDLCQNQLIPLERCFWKKLTTGVTTYKNEEIIEHSSVTITVGPGIWLLATY